jgi:hypothetical protein
VDHDGETLQKAYNKKVGKYDQLRREIAEAYPGRPVNQYTIVVSATGAFMKQSQTEFARATRLQGKQLARFSRDVVDAAIRGSFDIYTDSMSRIQYHREHKVEPEVADLLEKEAFDCAMDDDEETERPENREVEPEMKPGMSEEIEGLDEEISPIEKWQASFVAHEAAIAERRLPPEIGEHPDGHKSTKLLERPNQDLARCIVASRSKESRTLHPLGEEIRRTNPPRAASAAAWTNAVPIPPSPIVYVKLLLFGEHKSTISVPENITRDDLRKRASQEFRGRVAIQPDMFPVKEGSIVVCYPTYVPELEKGAEKMPIITPHLEREGKLYPLEVPANATFEDMVIVASNIMGCPSMLRTDTRFPLRTDDHVLIATEHDVHMEQMKLEALRVEDELKISQKLNAIQWTMADLPPRPASRDVLPLAQVFANPPPESVSKWGEEMEVHFEDVSGTQVSTPIGYVYTTKEGERWDRAASEAFGIPMHIVDPRTELKGMENVILKCKPVFGEDEMTAPILAAGRRQFRGGTSYQVHIKLQFKDRMVPLEVLNSSPAEYVEFQARVHFGAVVEFNQPKPTTWTPGRIYHMRRATDPQTRGPTFQGQDDDAIQQSTRLDSEHHHPTNGLGERCNQCVVGSSGTGSS